MTLRLSLDAGDGVDVCAVCWLGRMDGVVGANDELLELDVRHVNARYVDVDI